MSFTLTQAMTVPGLGRFSAPCCYLHVQSEDGAQSLVWSLSWDPLSDGWM